MSLFPSTGCGFTDKENTRIVGGAPAKPGAWPWMVITSHSHIFDRILFIFLIIIGLCKAALMVGNAGDRDAKCGSALIAPDLIITAAHCLVEEDGSTKSPSQLSVRLGEHDIDGDSPDDAAIEVEVLQVLVHANFDLKTFKNDIGLLRLRQKVSYSSHSLLFHYFFFLIISTHFVISGAI